MTVRLLKKSTEWNDSVEVSNEDINDTFQYVSRAIKTIKNVTTSYTPTLDDDVLVMKPSSGSNSFTNVPLSGYYFTAVNDNMCSDGTNIFFTITAGSSRIGRLNISTQVLTDLGAFSSNGYTSKVTDGSFIYSTDYSTTVKKFNISTGASSTLATISENVYAIARNSSTGDMYVVGYTGKIYKVTTAGVVTTYQSSALYSNTVPAIFCDSSNNIYLTTGTASYKVVGGTATLMAGIVPLVPGYFNDTDNKIYYKDQVNGLSYFMTYDPANELRDVLTSAQYANQTAFATATHLYEGTGSSPNQFNKLDRSTYIPVLSLNLPTPSVDNTGKEYIVTAPYGYASQPFINGKILLDIIPTNTDHPVTSLTLPTSVYGASNRSLRLISDGTYWLSFRS